jgi:hypothetical protein
VLDLSAMRALHIDPDQRTAWAQTGLTAGQYTTAAGAYGRRARRRAVPRAGHAACRPGSADALPADLSAGRR